MRTRCVKNVPRITLPTKAFAMLADCAGLQNLHLEFGVERNLCLKDVFFRFQGQTTLHNNRIVPYDVLAKIKECAALREIKNLQSLWLDFNTFDNEPTGQFDNHGRPDYEWRRVQLSGGESGPYYDLEEELKKVMLVQK